MTLTLYCVKVFCPGGRQNAQKKFILLLILCATFHLVKSQSLWYYTIVKRESKHNLHSVASAKKIKRNFENPLDKPHKMWYNKTVR